MYFVIFFLSICPQYFLCFVWCNFCLLSKPCFTLKNCILALYVLRTLLAFKLNLFVCLAFCQILAQVSSLTRRVLVFLRIVCILPSAVSRRQAFLSLSVDLQGGACVCRFVGWRFCEREPKSFPLSLLSFPATSPALRTASRSRHGRSPPSGWLPVHRHAGGRGRAALPPGPHWDLPVWSSLLEETPRPTEGTSTLHTCLYLVLFIHCSVFSEIMCTKEEKIDVLAINASYGNFFTKECFIHDSSGATSVNCLNKYIK